MTGPFSRILHPEREAERLASTLPPWAPEPLVNLIRIYGPSLSPKDIAIAKNLHVLATTLAMKAFWRKVVEPRTIFSLSMTAAIFAATGSGELDGRRRLSPKEVDRRCEAVREAVVRLQRALRQTSFLLTNNDVLRAALESLDAEAEGRIRSDAVFGKRDRSTRGKLAPQHLRAFIVAVGNLLLSHGQREVANLVSTLCVVLLDEEPDPASVRKVLRKRRADLTPK